MLEGSNATRFARVIVLTSAVLATVALALAPIVPSLADGVVPPGFPDASTTGPVDETLIPATASGRVVTSFDGQVLENIHAENLLVRHNNVTVRNFRITRNDPDAWFAIAILSHLEMGDTVVGTVFEDGEIVSRDASGNPRPSRAVGINGSHFVAKRLDISYMENGVTGAEFVVEDSFIHNLEPYEGSHNDGIATVGGSNIVVRHNAILLPNHQTGTVSLFTDFGSIDNVNIEDNYLNGGSYTIYSRDKDNGYGAPTNVIITGNTFGRDYLFGILSADGDPSSGRNSWADTGELIDETGTETSSSPDWGILGIEARHWGWAGYRSQF